MARLLLLIICVSTALVDVGRPSSASSEEAWGSSWDWRRVLGPSGEAPVSAVAWHAASRQMAVADGQGVLVGASDWKNADTARRRFSGFGAVSDLVFEENGALWVAAERGLWFVTENGRLEDRSPAAGQAERRMYRIGVWASLRVAVGESGAFFSLDGHVWQRLLHGLPLGPFYAVGVRGPSEGLGTAEIWLGGPLDVWRIEVEPGPDRIRLGQAQRVRPVGRPFDERAVDLAFDLEGSEVVVLYPSALARASSSASGSRLWETVFPVWPPGARARRLFGSRGGPWVTTDQGLLHATDWPRAWKRTTGPPGISPMWVVIEQGDWSMLAAGAPGLFTGSSSEQGQGVGPERVAPLFPQGPSLRQLQAHALIYTGLRPDYFRKLRSGLSKRAWWPSLEIDASAAYDRFSGQDEDQSFTYGQLHDLRDRARSLSRDFEASISLAWDLGDWAYPSEAPELSREARQRVSLRDNMLDELNQLYFDRRRTLVALDAYGDKSDPEAVLLQLRAEELAAGLDAWTGGWFSAWRPPVSSSYDSRIEWERAGGLPLLGPSSRP